MRQSTAHVAIVNAWRSGYPALAYEWREFSRGPGVVFAVARLVNCVIPLAARLSSVQTSFGGRCEAPAGWEYRKHEEKAVNYASTPYGPGQRALTRLAGRGVPRRDRVAPGTTRGAPRFLALCASLAPLRRGPLTASSPLLSDASPVAFCSGVDDA
ncbi:hypothetical protein MRX96_003827 [Rhipicephalus microplus]